MRQYPVQVFNVRFICIDVSKYSLKQYIFNKEALFVISLTFLYKMSVQYTSNVMAIKEYTALYLT